MAGFRLTNESVETKFEWDAPQGIGSEADVDHYVITISSFQPPRASFQTHNTSSSPWTINLNYNTVYSAAIRAINCAGESDSFTLDDILSGICMYGVDHNALLYNSVHCFFRCAC